MARLRTIGALIALSSAACGDGGPPADALRIDSLPAPASVADSRPRGGALRVTIEDAVYAPDANTRVEIGRGTFLVRPGSGMPLSAMLEDVASSGVRDGRRWRVVVPELNLIDASEYGAGAAAGMAVRVEPARLVFDIGGRTLAVALSGRVRSRDGVVDGAVALAGARSRLTGRFTAADGSIRIDGIAAPVYLADVPLPPSRLPPDASVRGPFRFTLVDAGWSITSPSLDLVAGSSTIVASGGVADRGVLRLDDVELRLDGVDPGDLPALERLQLPGIDEVRGRVTADGDARRGIRLTADLATTDSLGRTGALGADGRVWLEPVPRLDVRLGADSLRLDADHPFALRAALVGDAHRLELDGLAWPLFEPDAIAGTEPLSERLRRLVRGAELRVRAVATNIRGEPGFSGSLALLESPESRGSATSPDLDGLTAAFAPRSPGAIEWLSARGRVQTRPGGIMNVRLRADSLPLELVPTPSAVRDLRGRAALELTMEGVTAHPSVSGRVTLHDFALRVPEYGAGVDSARLGLRLRDDRFVIEDGLVWSGGGRLRLQGGLQLAGVPAPAAPLEPFRDARLELTAHLDSFPAVETDSLRAVVSGAFRASGPLRHPHVDGELALVDGHAFEGRLAPDAALDPDDPPYAELAARVPWSASSDLPRQPQTARPPPLSADVRLRVTPAFRVVDEDSDLGSEGVLRLVVDSAGARADGTVSIREGFYAYYGDRFELVGGALRISDDDVRLAMLGTLRLTDRPLTTRRGGEPGWLELMPATEILGYTAPGTVLELLRRRTPLPATQTALAGRLLFGVPVQPVQGERTALYWRAAEPDDVVGHRSAVQGSGLTWSYVADELYDYVPLRAAYLRAGIVRTASPHPGWLMVGSSLEATLLLTDRLELMTGLFPGLGASPAAAARWVFREERLGADRGSVEVFSEPRFRAAPMHEGPGYTDRRRHGLRLRWNREY